MKKKVRCTFMNYESLKCKTFLNAFVGQQKHRQSSQDILIENVAIMLILATMNQPMKNKSTNLDIKLSWLASLCPKLNEWKLSANIQMEIILLYPAALCLGGIINLVGSKIK